MKRRILKIFVTILLNCGPCFSQSVLTGNYNNSRTNANLQETTLSPASVTPSSLGKLFSLSVDGQIYAQPLYLAGVSIPGKGTHNVVFAVTMRNNVYAFDADAPSVPLWSVSLGPSVSAFRYSSDAEAYSDILPENGILGTPVIDSATATLYVVAATVEDGLFYYRLHALDTASGAERFNGPTVINGRVAGIGDSSVNGSVAFDASRHLQRPALLLLNGTVYISFGSHGDAVPFHGWMFGYKADNIQNQVSVLNTTPNGSGGSLWQSGRGPAADADGKIYVVSGNGDTDEYASFSNNVLRLDPVDLTVKDWFAPFNFQFLNDMDADLGASGPLLIDGTSYLVAGGKQGVFYLLDRVNLGHAGAADAEVVQRIDTNNFGIFNMALWNRPDGPMLYLHTANAGVTAYRLTDGKFTTSPVAQSLNGFNFPFQGMTVSANGNAPGSGILWVLAGASYPLPTRAVLHAYNAEDLSELWNSDMNGAGALGYWTKFANPTVVNGKIYVPTSANELDVYGLTANAQIAGGPTITQILNGASYANGPLAPGEIIEIFGQNLGPASVAVGAPNGEGIFPAEVASTQVTFNGVAGPVIYSSDQAVSAVVPFEVAGQDSVIVQVSYCGKVSPAVAKPVAIAAPGLFSADGTGSGPASVLNNDGTLNTPANPARAGSIVTLFATGGGQTTPPSQTGAMTLTASPLIAPAQVTANGQSANVLFAGNALGKVAGTVQVNVQLPDGLSGDVPLVLSVGGVQSQATTTVSVQ